MTRLAFIDTETGGLTTDTSLLEVAVVITDLKLVELAHFSVKTKPDDAIYHVHPHALEVNKIDLIEHDKDALTYSAAATELEHFLADFATPRLTPAGWNLQFDQKFVQHYLLGDVWDAVFTYRQLDGQSALRFLQVQDKMPVYLGSLASCAKHFGLVDQAHTALMDCYTTIEVMRKFFDV